MALCLLVGVAFCVSPATIARGSAVGVAAQGRISALRRRGDQPVNTVAPVIAHSGQSLVVMSNGTWTSGGDALTYTYQWQRCDRSDANCADISSAAADSYQPTSADVGHELQVVVTATDTVNQTQQSAASNTLTTWQSQSQRTFPVDHMLWGIATADLNGDGIPDLLTTDTYLNGVAVLLGDGNGNFRATSEYSTGTRPTSVAIGDFNGDGHPDLAVADEGENHVSILLGWGNGSLYELLQHTFTVGPNPYAIAVGDFNGDGIPDVITANESGTVSLLLGNGDGTFQAHGGGIVDGVAAGVAVADFNGDGKQDFAVTNYTNDVVSVFLGNGDGTFQGPHSYPVGAHPLSVAVGDFNGDGVPDLAVTDSNGVAVLLGNGDGSFGTPQQFATGSDPSSVAVGDVDGDGNQDLVVADNVDNDVSVLLGNGDGTFGSPQTVPVGSGPTSVVAADLNGDGAPDIAVPNSEAVTVSVLLNGSAPYGSAGIPVTGSTAGAGSVLIDELRLAGPSGAGDQFVELHNTTASPVSVGGWQLQGSAGGVTTLPLGTTIPANGHLLVSAPQLSYSIPLWSYAVPDAELTSGSLLEPAAGGVRLVAPGGAVIDKVGFAGTATGFHSGTGLAVPATLPTGQFAWVRKFSNGTPVNTHDNASDFSYVATNDNDAAHGSPVLGAPGPDDLRSPSMHNDILQSALVDPAAAQSAYPNRIYTAGSPGTLIVNRTLYNCSGQTPIPGTGCANVPPGTTPMTVTRLRFRITGLTTIDSPGAGVGQAILKADTSSGESGLPSTTCSGTTTVLGLPLDNPSASGSGGLNSTWTATADLPPGGLQPGGCINLEFEFDVAQTGQFSFAYNAEDDLIRAPRLLPTSPCPTPTSVHATHVPDTVTGSLGRVSTVEPRRKPARPPFHC